MLKDENKNETKTSMPNTVQDCNCAKFQALEDCNQFGTRTLRRQQLFISFYGTKASSDEISTLSS